MDPDWNSSIATVVKSLQISRQVLVQLASMKESVAIMLRCVSRLNRIDMHALWRSDAASALQLQKKQRRRRCMLSQHSCSNKESVMKMLKTWIENRGLGFMKCEGNAASTARAGMFLMPALASGTSESSAVRTTELIAAQATDVTVKIHEHVSAQRCENS
jgi:hypothetical protein